MEIVVLKPLFHRGKECIGIYFDIHFRIQGALQKTGLVKFSRTHKCWYVPLSKENYNKIFFALEGLATFEQSALHQYLSEKKKEPPTTAPVSTAASKPVTGISASVPPGEKKESFQKTIKNKSKRGSPSGSIYTVNAHILPAMEQRLKLKSYSASTIRTYLNEVGAFLRTIRGHPADEFNTQRIMDYLQYCAEKLGLTENTLHSRINALKFYYEQVLKREKFFWDIPRPKKAFQLPKVLSKEEMARLIRAIDNIKHRTMIMLGYACGLRVSEITGLDRRDVDEDRRLLIIRRGKGKKDRVASLSPVMLILLREYLTAYKPEKYLFEGQYKGASYSTRSLESIIQAAKKKAGILKSGSMHMLRHSFATHLLDKGTDVVFIQKLLGHNDIKTTLRYLHVTNKDMLNILSPIEDIKDFL